MTLDEIAARIGVHELINRYTDAIVRYDEAAFCDCWSEDAEWTIFGQTYRGRQACLDFYAPLVEPTRHVRHLAHAPQLRVGPSGGKGRWQITETVFHKESGGLLILGVYNDVYAIENGVWRFLNRRFELLYQGPFAFEADAFAPLAGAAAAPF